MKYDKGAKHKGAKGIRTFQFPNVSLNKVTICLSLDIVVPKGREDEWVDTYWLPLAISQCRTPSMPPHQITTISRKRQFKKLEGENDRGIRSKPWGEYNGRGVARSSTHYKPR